MTISRPRVLLRAKYGWPTETVAFSKTDFHTPDGYRGDAAGFVSMCWDIPLHAPHSWGGMSTVTLATDGWVKEIPIRDLLPGDAIGYCGPDSVDMDGGFVVIFEKFMDGYAIVWQQLPISSPGPARRGHAIDYRRWHAYRFRDIAEDEVAA